MRSVAFRFLLPLGLLILGFSVLILYRLYVTSRQYAEELLSQQAALAMEFNLAVREYGAEKIRPAMSKFVGKDGFDRETMSTSYMSRSIFESVRKKFPDCIIRFACDDPRNPVNRANDDELRMIGFFSQNPDVGSRTDELTIDGQQYLAYFVPKRMQPSCNQCHGDLKDAPAALLQQYGDRASFHRKLGDVVGVDTVAVPTEAIRAALSTKFWQRSIYVTVGLLVIFASAILIFHFVVSRRLTAMAGHFRHIASQASSDSLTPLKVQGRDEIGVLAGAFNALVEKLRASQESLQVRVEQRTAELSKANEYLRQENAERRRAEEALRASERRFRELADLLPQTVFEADTTGRLLFANRRGFVDFGYQPEDFDRGMNIAQTVAPEDRPRAAENYQRVLHGMEPSGQQYLAIRKDGSTFPVIIYSTPVVREGQTVGLRGIIMDITQRAQLESQLLQAQKMEAIGQLAGGVAHDFNNMLTIVQGNAQLLQRSLAGQESPLRLVGEVLTASARAADLAGNLMSFARKGTLRTSCVDLHSTVRHAVQLLAPTLGGNIDIQTDLGAQEFRVMGDAGHLQNALVNLAINARDAMPEGGRLVFTTENAFLHAEECRSLPGVKPGQYVKVSVSDTGIGMDEQTLSHLFEPFFTTKAVGKGTGLGLASVYGCLRQHNGGIQVHSSPGKGSTFVLWLPAATPPAKTTSPDSPPAAAQSSRTGRVLLVDDEEAIRNIGARALTAAGHTVAACSDGTDAVAYMRQHGASVDLVILDMVMPRMGGSECLKQLRIIAPRVPVVIASGFVAKDTVDNLLKQGAVGFLSKPFDLVQLAEMVSHHLPA